MCVHNENLGKGPNFKVEEWREQMIKLVENVPHGVSLVTICSTEIDRNKGMTVASLSGTKGDLLFMLHQVLKVDNRIHDLFEESRKHKTMFSDFTKEDIRSFLDGFLAGMKK